MRVVRFISVLASLGILVVGVGALVQAQWGWLVAAIIAEVIVIYAGAGAHFLVLRAGVSKISELVADAHYYYVHADDTFRAMVASKGAVRELDKHYRHNPKELAHVRLLVLVQHSVVLGGIGDTAGGRRAIKEAILGSERASSADRDLLSALECAGAIEIEYRNASPRADVIEGLYERIMDTFSSRR